MKQAVLTEKELSALKEIRNSLIHSGNCPSLRDLMNHLGYRSPRSAALLVNKLMAKGIVRRNPAGALQIIKDIDNEASVRTVSVPLVGTASCGLPVFAEENIQAVLPVSVKLARPPHKYFFVRAKGDSMNKKGIKEGDFVLVRRQVTAENGDTIIALVDNEITIKQYWVSGEAIVLKPCSSNKIHKPIIVTRDFHVQGVVVTTISNLEDEQ